jgi:hypothetical protein
MVSNFFRYLNASTILIFSCTSSGESFDFGATLELVPLVNGGFLIKNVVAFGLGFSVFSGSDLGVSLGSVVFSVFSSIFCDEEKEEEVSSDKNLFILYKHLLVLFLLFLVNATQITNCNTITSPFLAGKGSRYHVFRP